MLIYLHGFNSSPRSHKAQVLRQAMEERGLGARFACPALPHWPEEALAAAERELVARPRDAVTMVGSSLGGFYATCLAERYGVPAVLINPAIEPHVGLRAWLGPQQNPYTGERYELTEEHLHQWQRQYVAPLHLERYLLLVETGDEVLDYRAAVKRYRGARQVVVQGGDHSLATFPAQIPQILRFAGLA
ncbi:MAG TPA: YqiA/YcfP family alpha/beta fold hydrolase [Burkholderiales bacterium]